MSTIELSSLKTEMQANCIDIVKDSQSPSVVCATVTGYVDIEMKDGSDFDLNIDREELADKLCGGLLIPNVSLAKLTQEALDSGLEAADAHDPEYVCNMLNVDSVDSIDLATHDNSINTHVELANMLTNKEEAAKAIAILKAVGMDGFADNLNNLICHSMAHVVAQEKSEA
ncbi:hypothetical protein VCHA53O466_140116 [Vibrio chagasii]|nr:hypothetical protein VCHA53O466_140116 [Vibrio chagasii]